MCMRALILAALAVPLSSAVSAEALMLPSGLVAQALPVIWDEDVSAIRLRFVLAALGQAEGAYAQDQEQVFADMHWLCEAQLATLWEQSGDPRGEGWEGIVVTLMDREVTFGTVDASSTQLFEWFSLTGDGCEQDWDAYHD